MIECGTVGNGIIEILAGLSAKPKVIGFSCQSAKIFFIDEPQNQTDTPNAKIHQTLFQIKRVFTAGEN